jgi:hypothetical protein
VADWFRGVAVGGAGPSSADVHDFGPGLYFTNLDHVAGDYAKFRSGDFNNRNERTTALPAILYGNFDEATLGRTLDLTAGQMGEAWGAFEREGVPGMTNRDVMRTNPDKYLQTFKTFTNRNGIHLNEYSAIIGPEYQRGGKQLCIRNSSVADRVGRTLIGRSLYAPAPPPGNWGDPPQVITVTPGRGQANGSALMALFQIVDTFANYINDKYQTARASAAIKTAILEIRKWQYDVTTDGALVMISYSRKVMNDPIGIVKRTSLIHPGDVFEDVEIIFAPTYAQAMSQRKMRGGVWKELSANSPYAIERSSNMYWIEPRAKSPSQATLRSPVGWWLVKVKPSFVWYYEFKANGQVVWTDPGNNKTGVGVWKLGSANLQIEWESKSSEKWFLPLHPNGQAGTCLWANGLQDVRADFGVAPPGNVASPPPNSPVGRWYVWVDHNRFWWVYNFDSRGGVRWTDQGNGMTGTGTWKFANDYLVISWASGSKDLWDTPLNPKAATGSATMKGRTYDLRAERQ